MESYTTPEGAEVTDELLARWDDDADRGIYHGEPGEIIVKKPLGRPPLYDEPMVPVTFRLPESDLRALEDLAQRRGIQFADIMREASRRELYATADD